MKQDKTLQIIGIMAADPQGVIGKNNGLPWDYPDDIQYFLKTTQGHPVVMGRKTFEATPQSFFKERRTIVFSRNPQQYVNEQTDRIFVSSLMEFLSVADQWIDQKIYMIGGAEIANLFFENGLISEFILTSIHKSYEGDVQLNMKRFEGWTRKILLETPDFTIYQLIKPLNK